tara:strand:+ start:1822 stop:2586 length:765 start_codon:yes stop_codon:yes gene_type:complete
MIHNEAAYEAGKRRNIAENARKGNLKRWLAEGEDHQELYNWLDNSGEYAKTQQTKTIQSWVNHPLCDNMFAGEFGTLILKLSQTLCGNHYWSLVNNYGEEVEHWGKLSEKQTTVVRNALANAKKYEAQKEVREAKWAEESSKRQYVGEVGDNKFLVEGIIKFVTSWETDYGYTYLTVISDKDGNTIKYKGNSIADKNFGVKMIATIKSHEEYKGEKQTIVNRPRKIEIITLGDCTKGISKDGLPLAEVFDGVQK